MHLCIDDMVVQDLPLRKWFLYSSFLHTQDMFTDELKQHLKKYGIFIVTYTIGFVGGMDKNLKFNLKMQNVKNNCR